MASSNRETDIAAPTVLIDGAVVRFGETRALQIDHLRIDAGERVFVLGRSGSGKTTLSRLIKGRLRASEGTVRILGQDPGAAAAARRGAGKAFQRRVAMIDQAFFLVPRMNVVNNVLSGALGRVGTFPSLFGHYPSEEWDRAESILGEVELEGLGERRVETLSGGQRQRVAIARALMQNAELILADEPVSNLDPELAEESLELMVGLTERRGITLMMNLHQPRLAKRYATRVIGLHQGRVVFDGLPDSLSTESEELIYTGPELPEDDVQAAKVAHVRPATTIA